MIKHGFRSVLRHGLFQALVMVPVLAHASANINLSFSPVTINQGDTSQLVIDFTNTNTSNGLTALAATVLLPANLTVAATPAITDSCGFTTKSATAGAGVVVLNGGSVVAATTVDGKCTVTLNVTSTVPNNYSISFPAGPASGFVAGGSTVAGFSARDAGVSVTNSAPSSPTLQVTALSAPTGTISYSPTTIYEGETSTVTVSLTNANASVTLPLTSFSYALATGMQVAPAATSSLSAGCSGAVLGSGAHASTVVAGDTSLTLTGGMLAGGATCTIAVLVAVPATTGTRISTAAAAASIGNTRGLSNASFNATNSTNLTVKSPLTVAESTASSSVLQGEPTTLTLTLTNSSTVNEVTVTNYIESLTGGTVLAGVTPAVSCTGTGSVNGTLTATAAATSFTLAGATIGPGGVCTITLGIGSGTVGSVTTSVSASTSIAITGGASLANPSVNSSVTVKNAATVAHAFTLTTTSVRPNQSVTLTVTLTNASSVNALAIGTFTDTLGTGDTIVSASAPACSGAGASNGSLTATAGASSFVLSGAVAGPSSTCVLTLQVQAGGSATQLKSSSVATGTGMVFSNAANASVAVAAASATETVVSTLDLAVSGPGSTVYQGQLVTYTYTLYNYTSGIASNVSFADNLPLPSGGVQMTLDASSSIGTGCSGGTVTAVTGSSFFSWTGGSIVAGTNGDPGKCTITVVALVPANAVVNNNYVNSIAATAVTAIAPGGAAVSNLNGTSVTSKASASITVKQTLGGSSNTTASIYPAGTTSLVITISNPTSTALTSASFSETLTGLTIALPASASTTCTGGSPLVAAVPGSGTLSASGLSIPAASGSAGTCTVTVNITGAAVGSYPTSVPASAIQNAQNLTNSSASPTATVTVNSPLTGSAAFLPTGTGLGGTAQLTVTLTNSGVSGLTGVNANIPLPAGATAFTVAPAPAAGTTCGGAPVLSVVANAASASLSGVTLTAGASCTVSFNVLTTTNSGSSNWALAIPIGSLTSAEGYANTSAVSKNLTFVASTSLGLVKSFTPATVNGGAVSALAISISNSSANTVNAVAFTDTFPAGMVVYSVPGATLSSGCVNGSVSAVSNDTKIRLTGADIAAGGTCTVTVNVTSLKPQNLTNTLAVSSLSSQQGFTNGLAASATLATSGGLGVEQSFSPVAVAANTSSHLSMILVNTQASTTITGIAFTDTLPAGLKVATTPNLTADSGCNITPSATAGGTTVGVSGLSLAALSTCTVGVDVVATANGAYTNTIAQYAVLATPQGYSNQSAAVATLNVLSAPTITVTPTPTSIATGTSTGSATAIKISNSNTSALTAAALTVNLPAGLTVAFTPGASLSSGCGAGNLVANAGSGVLTLTAATLPSAGFCTITVNLSSNTPGSYTIAVPTAAVSTAEGISNVAAASGSITVLQLPTLSQAFSVASMAPGATAKLTLTLGNPNASAITLSSNLVDTLPVTPGAMTVSGLDTVNTTCTQSKITAATGATSVTFSSAGGAVQVPATTGCVIVVNVTATATGTYANGLTAGALATSAGASQVASTALLVVSSTPPPTAATLTASALNSTLTTAQALTPALSGSANGAATITGYTIASLPANGTLYCNAAAVSTAGTACSTPNALTFVVGGATPNPVIFTYTVTDSNGVNSAAATYSIPLATPPSASVFTAVVNNNASTPVAIGPMAATANATGATITGYTVTALPGSSALYCGSTAISTVPTACNSNTLKIVPTGNPTGSTTLTYTATDSNGLTSSAATGTVTWNTPPTATAITNPALSGAAPSAVSLSSMAGMATTSAATISSYHVVTLPASGTLYCTSVALTTGSLPANCAANGLSYLHATPAVASTSFTFTVTDSNGMVSAPATFTLPQNLVPTASAFTTAVNNNASTAVTVGPMVGTATTSGATITGYTVTGLPASSTLYCGSAVIGSVPATCNSNTLKIVPTGNPTGSTALTYTVTDSTGLSSTAATGTVNWNTPPTATAITNPAISGASTTPVSLSSMAGVVTTSGASISSYQVATLPASGALYCASAPLTSASLPVNCAANGLTYLHATPIVSSASFTFAVTDSNGMVSAPATFALSITQTAVPTVAAFTSAVNNNAASPFAIGPMAATANATGATITGYTVTALPGSSALYCGSTAISTVPTACNSNTLKIVPTGNPTGSTTLTYTATDSNGLTSSAATGTVTWNTPPTATAITNPALSGAAPSAVSLSSMAGMATTSAATISSYHVVTLPASGTLYCTSVALTTGSLPANCAANGLSYLHATPAVASTSFTFTVTDSNGMVSAPATFTLPQNLVPTASAFTTAVNNNASTAVTVGPMVGTATTSGATITGYTVTGLPASSTLYCGSAVIGSVPATCNSNTLKIVPTGNPTGSTALTYTVTDSTGLSSTAATGTVNWNTPPTATAPSVPTVTGTSSSPIALPALLATPTSSGAAITIYTVTSLPSGVTLYCAGAAIASVPANCAPNALSVLVSNASATSTNFRFTATDSNGMVSSPVTLSLAISIAQSQALAITLDAMPVLTAGQAATFSASARNTGGNMTSNGVVMLLEVPAALPLQSLKGSGWSCARADGSALAFGAVTPVLVRCINATNLAPAASSTPLGVQVVPNLAYIGQTVGVAASVDAQGGTQPANPGTQCAPASACAQNQGALLSPGAPQISVHFDDPVISVGGSTQLAVMVSNPIRAVGLTGVQLTVTLPAGMTPVPTAILVSTCAGTASVQGNALTLSGVALPALQSCQIAIPVTSVLATGTAFTASVPAHALHSDQGLTNALEAHDQLTLQGSVGAVQHFASPTTSIGRPVQWILHLSNGAATAVVGASLTHTFPAIPAAMLVAPQANASTTCSGTLQAIPGTSSVTLTGATIPAAGSCDVVVEVASAVTGQYVDTLPVGALLGTYGSVTPIPVTAAATATLQIAPPAAIAGTVRKGGQPVAGVLVTLVNAQGVVMATATTAADGQYAMTQVPPSIPGDPATTYSLLFTKPGSIAGMTKGVPPSGDPATGGTGDVSAIRAVTLAPSESATQYDAVIIDPSGVVYDALSRQPVAGAAVFLIGPNGLPVPDSQLDLMAGTSNGALTGPDGGYALFLSGASSGRYTLQVRVPAGYVQAADASLVSRLIPAQAGAYTPALGGGVEQIQPQSQAPAVGADTRYWLAFNFTYGTSPASTSNGVSHNHLPIDPSTVPNGLLALSKVGSSASVELADSLLYTITLTNGASAPALAVVVHDTLPRGFRYIAGSALATQPAAANRRGDAALGLTGVGPRLDFQVGDLPAGAALTLTYRVRVGVGSQQGDGINRAQATAQGGVQSNRAQFKVNVSDGVFTSEACVVGKVFLDCDGDGMQLGPDEPGVPGVRLYLENGLFMVSDEEGKFSLCGLSANTHVLKVDPISLPVDSVPLAVTQRHAGDGGSQFLDLKAGELFRADVSLGGCSAGQRAAVQARRKATAGAGQTLPPAGEGGDFEFSSPPVPGSVSTPSSARPAATPKRP